VAVFFTTTLKGIFLFGLRQAEPTGYLKNLSNTKPSLYYGCREKGLRIREHNGLLVNGLGAMGP